MEMNAPFRPVPSSTPQVIRVEDFPALINEIGREPTINGRPPLCYVCQDEGLLDPLDSVWEDAARRGEVVPWTQYRLFGRRPAPSAA